MSVYKESNGFYYYDFQLDGVRYCKSTRSKNKRLAMEIEANVRDEVLRRGYMPKRFGENKRFFELCSKFEGEIPEKSYKVILSNLNVLKNYFGDRLVSEVNSPNPVSTFKDDLRKKGLSVARINHLLATLKRMMSLAVEQWEWLPENRIKGVALLPGANKRIRILSEEEEELLLPACPRWLCELIQFDLLSGFRLSECLSLMIKDVDFQRKLVTCWECKGGSSRTIPLGWDLDLFLQEKTKIVKISGKLFPYSSGQVEWNLRKVCDQIGMKDFHFHDLRHTVATRLIKKGASPFEVMRFMGWKSLAMVERYTHLVVEDTRKTADLLHLDTNSGKGI